VEVALDELPVDQVAEVLDVLGPHVPVVDVVGVFPDVDGEEGLEVVDQRISGIRGVDNADPVVLFGEPGPP